MKVLGRPRAFDRDIALEAAMLVFWRKGFLATSMNDLCEAMGIRSPSLYAAFGSKDNLYVEAVQRYNAVTRSLIWDHIDDGPTVRASMQKLLLAAAKAMPANADGLSSCLVTLAAGDECPATAPDITKMTRADNLATLRAGLKRAVTVGELPRSTNIDRLSRFYLGVVQGMAIQARDGASQAELKGVAETAMAAWPAAPS
jgi:AcrR family transcriptional regulator